MAPDDLPARAGDIGYRATGGRMEMHSIGAPAVAVALELLRAVAVSPQVTFFIRQAKYTDIDVPSLSDTGRALSGESGVVSACLMRSHFRFQPTDRR